MKHRRLLGFAGVAGVGALALVAFLSVAAASSSKPSHAQRAAATIPAPKVPNAAAIRKKYGGQTKKASHAQAAAAIVAPKVPNAAAIRKKYHGQKITFVGDSVGNGHVRDTRLAKRFTHDTGIKVTVEPHPAASDQAYSQLARAFSSKSSSIDVAMIDVVWPGAFAPYLVNLKPKLGKQSKLHLASIVANDTIKGKLVAMPWFGDYGILYYRTDLLKKYGYKAPPKTWSSLFAMAKKIQDGERSSNPNFSGFVFQGNAYEGLTCNALEWIASAGGGNLIDNGKVTINNAKARTILDAFRTQIGKITPPA